MDILLKYPSRSRPNLFADTVNEWQKRAAQPEKLQWLVSLDADDASLSEYRSKCDALDIDPIIGTSKTKVEAINADMQLARDPWDVLVLVSDDMRPVVDSWDDIIREQMPTLDMALWFVDGRQGELCTLNIFGRPVYERMKCIYHPAFESVYCDNYFHFILEHEGRLKRIGAPQVFVHEWQKHNNDALMKRNENPEGYQRDKATFERLKSHYLKTGEAWPQ